MNKHAYNQRMRYSYDPEKRTSNLKKHGYDFEDAPQVIESDRFDYHEQRFITLGLLRGDVVVIATAETDENIRVISMRKAERNEHEIFYRKC
ncbi:BrnT family toxin [Candidatus Accumulibacter vicinus]|nr:BrnT family toxin [Candidatus Accumulibacter vicinus]